MKIQKNKIVLIVVGGIIILGGVCLVFSKRNGDKEIEKGEGKVGITSEIVIPKNLDQCTTEIVTQNCDKAAIETVCGYDHTVYESGKEKDTVLQFKSACHYCKFYGLTGEKKDVAGTKIKGLGFEKKPCDQGMYRK